jgi:hypothetical protein
MSAGRSLVPPTARAVLQNAPVVPFQDSSPAGRPLLNDCKTGHIARYKRTDQSQVSYTSPRETVHCQLLRIFLSPTSDVSLFQYIGSPKVFPISRIHHKRSAALLCHSAFGQYVSTLVCNARELEVVLQNRACRGHLQVTRLI